MVLFHLDTLIGATSLFGRGYLCVDLFFLLSGFVLTLAAEPAMAHQPAGIFIRARIVRLWPMAALGTLAGGLAFLPWTGLRDTIPLVLLGLAMIPLSRQGFEAFPLNGPQWSLLWELLVNALHATVLHRLSTARLLVLTGLASAALAAVIAATGHCAIGSHGTDWWKGAPRVLWSYGLGMAMARHWRQRGGARPMLDWRLALVAPVLFLMTLDWLPLPRAIGDIAAVIVVLPVLFWVAANAVPPPRAGPALQRLGAISFPLYALHVPLLVLGSFAPNPAIGGMLAASGAVAAAVLLAQRWPMLAGAGTRAPA